MIYYYSDLCPDSDERKKENVQRLHNKIFIHIISEADTIIIIKAIEDPSPHIPTDSSTFQRPQSDDR